jgi:hypothetical protein
MFVSYLVNPLRKLRVNLFLTTLPPSTRNLFSQKKEKYQDRKHSRDIEPIPRETNPISQGT